MYFVAPLLIVVPRDKHILAKLTCCDNLHSSGDISTLLSCNIVLSVIAKEKWEGMGRRRTMR
jgi:hypothetical protein